MTTQETNQKVKRPKSTIFPNNTIAKLSFQRENSDIVSIEQVTEGEAEKLRSFSS